MALPNLNNKPKDEKEKKSSLPSGLPTLGLPKMESVEDIEEMEEIVDDFTSVDIDDIGHELDDEEVFDDVEEIEESHQPQFTPLEEPFVEEEDPYDEDKFIDKKKRRIKPTGGKKSKRQDKIKADDFDDRKNALVFVKIARSVAMVVILLLFAFGIKNTFFPSHVYTEQQIRSFAQQGAGQTGFPKEKGQSFAEAFVYDFLTIDHEDPSRGASLAYYYTGVADGALIPQINRETGKKTKQSVIIQPQTFDMIMATDHSAQYKVTSYVTNTDGSTKDGSVPSGRWVSFAVNVYFDKTTGQLAITPESPMAIPKYELSAMSEVPLGVTLGNGNLNNEITPVLAPTIDGYINAYANVSVKSHDEIMQYIPKGAEPELFSGFGGSVEVKGGNKNGITKLVYDTDTPGEYKADVTVTWNDKLALGGDNALAYKSRYVMTLTKTTEDKYLVTSFKPYVYAKSEN